ncbi:Na+/H+ antiporter NhaC family protein [Priestia megaterium]|uniref:Na+/H+ antiporter NhaC family protein n=1 Tax=Priestia megaterium TaxID=1404 RepID=UPI002570F473|nr:Na+/H+ antiporter NhaC family protein [Priestia megaterium]WJD83577.1 Na+/H+ antiporter NhaC family protein [Priestia megaterium]
MEKVKQAPTVQFAIVSVIILVLFITLCLSVLNIPIVIALLFSWIILAPFALKLGYTLKEIEESIYDMIKVGAGLFALLIAIGCMVSIWVSAGTIPSIIHWGLDLINPQYFLVIAFIICILISIPTGTNWGTISTIGVAMMGIGLGMGLNPGLVAGAVATGSIVGDIISPVSDTTLLTTTISRTNLIKHVKHAARIVIPSVILTSVLYIILGFMNIGGDGNIHSAEKMSAELSKHFNLGLWTMVPLVVAITLLILKQSAVSSIMISCIFGLFIAVFYQGFSISEVGNFLASGFVIDTGNKVLDSILNTGGISSMLNLIAMVVAALGVGGIFKGTGILDKLVESLGHIINSRVGLTNMTFVGTSICSTLVAANYFSLIMNATLMAPLYKKMKYRPENASRAIINFTDTISMMVPWSLNGTFLAATLGLPIFTIIPFMFFNFILIVLELISGYTGLGMTKYTDEEYEKMLEEKEEDLTPTEESNII